MNILSLHSQVVAGHVGNGAAVLPLQLLGFEVWAVPTVLYSNHPGHGSFTGRITPAGEISALINGLDQRNLLAACDGVLTGYLGKASQAAAVVDTIVRVRARNPNVMVCCDPILGDQDSGIYVNKDLPEAMLADLIPHSDVVTPNHFELETLTGMPARTLEDSVAAARQLIGLGPDLVVCSSLRREGADPDQIETLLVSPNEAWLSHHDKLAKAPNGTGDMLAALFLGHRLLGRPPADALSNALSAVWSVISAGTGAPDQELALVSAQSSITTPTLSARIEKID